MNLHETSAQALSRLENTIKSALHSGRLHPAAVVALQEELKTARNAHVEAGQQELAAIGGFSEFATPPGQFAVYSCDEPVYLTGPVFYVLCQAAQLWSPGTTILVAQWADQQARWRRFTLPEGAKIYASPSGPMAFVNPFAQPALDTQSPATIWSPQQAVSQSTASSIGLISEGLSGLRIQARMWKNGVERDPQPSLFTQLPGVAQFTSFAPPKGRVFDSFVPNAIGQQPIFGLGPISNYGIAGVQKMAGFIFATTTPPVIPNIPVSVKVRLFRNNGVITPTAFNVFMFLGFTQATFTGTPTGYLPLLDVFTVPMQSAPCLGLGPFDSNVDFYAPNDLIEIDVAFALPTGYSVNAGVPFSFVLAFFDELYSTGVPDGGALTASVSGLAVPGTFSHSQKARYDGVFLY